MFPSFCFICCILSQSGLYPKNKGVQLKAPTLQKSPFAGEFWLAPRAERNALCRVWQAKKASQKKQRYHAEYGLPFAAKQRAKTGKGSKTQIDTNHLGRYNNHKVVMIPPYAQGDYPSFMAEQLCKLPLRPA